MNFESADEVRDASKVQASLARLKRISRPARFVYQARCAALDGKPLLLLASPGRRVDSGLAAELKQGGSRAFKGKVYRRGMGLVFAPRGSQPNRAEMMRLISAVGRQHGVALPLRRLFVTSAREAEAITAMDGSVRQLRRVKKPTAFIYRPRWAALRDGPAFMLGGRGRERHFDLLRGGRAVEGEVRREEQTIILAIHRGTATAAQINRDLRRIAMDIRASVPRVEVRVEDAPAPAPSEAPTAAPAPAPEPEKDNVLDMATARRRKEEKAQQEAAEEARQAAERERAAAEKARQEAEAEKARQEAEAARQRAEADQQRQEQDRRRATLPALQRRYDRLTDDIEDSQEEVDEARAAVEREARAFAAMNKADSLEDVIDALIDLQEEIAEAEGKPDKDIRKLQATLQRMDDLDDALEELAEWYDERKDDLGEELAELEGELDKLKAEAAQLKSEIDEIEGG